MMKYLRTADPVVEAANYDDDMSGCNPGGLMDENEMNRVSERARAIEKVDGPGRVNDIFALSLSSKIFTELKTEEWEL